MECVAGLTRKVSPFYPPTNRDLSGWGTLDSETARRLQVVLDKDVNRLRIPGLQASVRTSDGKTWSGNSGTVDLKRQVLLTSNHILRVGSFTKTFTAALILQLVDAGLLSLDDSLTRWFPEYPNAKDITIRQLLNHTSGTFNYFDSRTLRRKMLFPGGMLDPQELVDTAAHGEPSFEPGNRHEYGNTNYVLLALVAEQITGESSAGMFRNRFIDPLGLKNTYFLPYEDSPEMLIVGFDRDYIPLPGLFALKPGNHSWSSAAFTAAAMISTTNDMLTWLDALLGGEVLSSDMLEQAKTFVDAVNPRLQGFTGCGLGLMRYDIDSEELWGHAGSFIGFTSIALHSPKNNYTIAVAGNLSEFNPGSVVANLQQVILPSQ